MKSVATSSIRSLRRRKIALKRKFGFPEEMLPGSLALSSGSCGKHTCRCATGQGHPSWSWTFMAAGKKRVQRIPKDAVDDVRRRVQAGRRFQQALREFLTINAELWVRLQKQELRRRAE